LRNDDLDFDISGAVARELVCVAQTRTTVVAILASDGIICADLVGGRINSAIVAATSLQR
jgi:hypothetical protein